MDNIKIKLIGVLKEDNSAMSNLAGILHCRRRLEWTREWLKKNQSQFMAKENLMKEIQFRSNETYHLNCFFDITEKQFRYLVNKLGPCIINFEPHRKKKSFSAEERLAITLKYLATGEFHSCRNYCFRASKPVILKMIGNICLTIYETLKDMFISTPKTEEQWKIISDGYYKKLHIPKCLGSLTMKHMTFGKPALRQNDIEDTLIITAIVDSNDYFIYANVEPSPDRHEEIFELSTIKDLIERNQFNIPKFNTKTNTIRNKCINNNNNNINNNINSGNNINAIKLAKGKISSAETNTDGPSSYYFVGHGALPLKPYLLNTLKYVPTCKDNSSTWFKFGSPEYEYCYAMDCVEYHAESALRMLTNIFPILSVPFRIDSENARKITLGCIALYNFLRKTEKSFFINSEKIKCEEECIVDDEEELQELEENSPNISDSNCLKVLRRQVGRDSPEPEAEICRQSLIDYYTDQKNSACF